MVIDTAVRHASGERTRVVSGGSLAMCRVVVGVIGAISCSRFLLHDWVRAFWTAPAHHFHWPGLWWVNPLPDPAMRVFVVLVAAAFALAAVTALRGRRARWPLFTAVAGFAYLGALDVAPYLNHYWLLLLLGALLIALPEGRWVPRWCVWAPRALVATTYVWAGIAKLDSDWLHGRQMRAWLGTHESWPVLGPWFLRPSVAVVSSWAGLVFDLAIVPLLLHRRTRPLAYVLVVVFHVATAALFPIGVFPWLMIGSTLVFFPPGWADQWWDRSPSRRWQPTTRGSPAWAIAVCLLVLALLPARGCFSDVWWSEQGGRFSWRVMAVNKVGLAELHVLDPTTGREQIVLPARDLSPLQAQQVSWQPDLILQWAHIVAHKEQERLGVAVEVRADVWVSVNGRTPQQLVDPSVDLARQRWTWTRPSWVLPPPRR
jgi:hypothetical protein